MKDAVNGYVDKVMEVRKASFDSFYEYVDVEFREYLRNQKDDVDKDEFNLGNMLHILSLYYKGGRYDFLLNSENEMNLLDDRFIVFELDNVKDNAVLFPIVTIIIIDTFIEKMRRLGKGVRKFMLIEEAWQALSKPNMAEFVKYLYKTIRKFQGDIAVVTQEVKDLVGNKIVKDVCVSQSDTKILLDFSGYKNDMKSVQEALGLSAEDSSLLLSTNKNRNFAGRNVYKEVFISMKKKSQVFAVEVSNEEYMAYTTEGKEKEALFDIKEKTECSMAKAIETYISRNMKNKNKK